MTDRRTLDAMGRTDDTTDGIARLIEHGLSPAEAVDYHYTVVKGWSEAEWAEVRDVPKSTVSRNAEAGRERVESGGA